MRLFQAILALAATAFLCMPTQAQQRPSDADIVKALKAGGHVVVIRHGATNSNQADINPLNPRNIQQQRQLSDKGVAAAKDLGKAIKALGVPVGVVLTSQFNRAYQTAVLAGLPKPAKSKDITEGGLVVSPDENARRAAALRKLAATMPKAGTNTVIVSHKPNIIDAFGKDWFEIKEGEASIFKPDGKSYTLVARLQMDEWTKLAATAGK